MDDFTLDIVPLHLFLKQPNCISNLNLHLKTAVFPKFHIFCQLAGLFFKSVKQKVGL